MRRQTLGSVAIAACALVWGMVGIVVREIDLPAMAIVFWRVLLAGAVVAAVLVASGRRTLLDAGGNRSPLALGVLLAVHWSFFFAAIQETSVASALLVTYAAPILVALLAPLVLRERVPRVSIAALAVSAAGIALISLAGGEGDGGVRALGVALALLAAISYAVLIVLVKRWAAGVHPVTFVVHESAAAAVVLAPAAVVAGLPVADDVGPLLLLGVVLTGGVGVVYIAGVQRVPATSVGILSYMEPVSGAVLAAVLLAEPLTPGVVAGGLAIAAAGIAVMVSGAGAGASAIEEPLPAPDRVPARSLR